MPAKDRDTYIDPDAEEDYFSAEEHDSVGSGDDFDQGPSSRGGKRAGGLGGGKKGAESRLKSKGKGGDVSLSLFRTSYVSLPDLVSRRGGFV